MEKEIKCVIWDLDNTIWNGTLLEGDDVVLKNGISEILNTLDNRGILNSIASKNDFDTAMNKLKEFKINHYFLYPEISWNSKSSSIENIRKNLNIGIDTILFIDDQQFEIEEVKSVFNEVECWNALDYNSLLTYSQLNPRFITEDSQRRRLMYIEDINRNKEELEYNGPKEEFLASLNMQFIISEAKEEDLKRAEELTIRTNQLNATGKTYDYNELDAFRQSDEFKLFVCELTDKYGSYGKIGLALVEMNPDNWHLKMLLMSCRVISRGVGTILLSYIMKEARKVNKRFLADFKQTNKNRMMYVTYRFANFNEISNDGNGNILFENNLSRIQEFPQYINLQIKN